MKKILSTLYVIISVCAILGCARSARYHQYEKTYECDISQKELMSNAEFLINRDYTELKSYRLYVLTKEKEDTLLYVPETDKAKTYYIDNDYGRIIFNARLQIWCYENNFEMPVDLSVRFIIRCRDKKLQIKTLPILLYDKSILDYPRASNQIDKEMNIIVDALAKEIIKKDLW